MLGFIIRLIGTAIVVFFCTSILDGVKIDTFLTALLVAFVLGLINAIIRPVLMILTLPINIMTLGLFSLVINALMIMLVDLIVPGFTIDNFLWALGLSILMSVVSGILSLLLPDDK